MNYSLSYFSRLFDALKALDQKAMTVEFKTIFDDETNGDGLKRGGKSFVVSGGAADSDCQAAFACLHRGNENPALVSARHITRRLDSKWLPRWTEDDDTTLENAETLIITDMFSKNQADSLGDAAQADLVWFIKDSITNGVVVILSIPDTDADLDLYGADFGEFVEKHFEVVNVPNSTSSRSKSKHSGNEAASINRSTRKRKVSKRTST